MPASPGFWIGLLVSFLVLVIPLGSGVWLPDVITSKEHTLGEMTTEEGHHYRVIQYLNGGIFYATKLQVTGPDGSTRERTLESDDSKLWCANFKVNEAKRAVLVPLGTRKFADAWN